MRRLLIPLVLAATFLVAGSAVADAQRPAKPVAHRGIVAVAAQYVGLERRALARELRSGKSLAQVATARGKSVDGLKQALLTALKTRLDARVAAGRLPADRAQRLLARAPQRIDRLVNRTWSRGAARARGRGMGVLGAAAAYIGVDRRVLAQELRSGTSLAQVATARGKSVDGLKQALLAALEAKLDAAVAAGRITQARAERLLARAPALIDRLVNRTRR